jgi:hypothetical protein
MTIIKNLWILNTIAISFFVLTSDPKTPSSTGSGSVSTQQSSLRTLIWGLITCFYILSLLISQY